MKNIKRILLGVFGVLAISLFIMLSNRVNSLPDCGIESHKGLHKSDDYFNMECITEKVIDGDKITYKIRSNESNKETIARFEDWYKDEMKNYKEVELYINDKNMNYEVKVDTLQHKETDFGSTSAHKARARRILSEKSR